jgi:hypothetical protein
VYQRKFQPLVVPHFVVSRLVDMSAAQAALSRSSLLDVPFPERWEHLKPLITQLYIDDNRKLPDIVQTLKDEYGFDAT